LKNNSIFVYIVLVIGLLFIPLFLETIQAQTDNTNSINSSLQKQTFAKNNQNASSNTNLGNITTFTASGFLRSTVIPQEDPDIPYLIFGYWNASINDEDMTNFIANFTMSRVNGSQMHTHQISNFVPANSVFLNNELGGSTLMFAGNADVYTNHHPKWNNTDVAIIIDNFNTISIALDSKGTDNHFNGEVLGGVVESIKDPNLKELLLLVFEPSPVIVPVVPSDDSSAQADQNNANANKKNADILSNIGEAIKNLFKFGNK